MENLTSLFKQFEPMILDRARTLAKKYFLEPDDIYSKGLEIFMNTVQKFDKQKSSFSTYLFNNLKDLNNYCKDQYRMKVKNVRMNDDEESLLLDFHIFQDTIIKMESKLPLSKNAQEILSYIVDRKWEVNPGVKQHKPSLSFTIREYKKKGVRRCEVIKAWKELGSWWNENYCYF